MSSSGLPFKRSRATQLTAEDLRIELRLELRNFMDKTLAVAFQNLQASIKLDVREEMRTSMSGWQRQTSASSRSLPSRSDAVSEETPRKLSDEGNASCTAAQMVMQDWIDNKRADMPQQRPTVQDADNDMTFMPTSLAPRPVSLAFQNRHIRMNRFRAGLDSVAKKRLKARKMSGLQDKIAPLRADTGHTIAPTFDRTYSLLPNDPDSAFAEEEEEFVRKLSKRSRARIAGLREDMRVFAQTHTFEHFTALLVVLNAVLLGAETDYRASEGFSRSISEILEISELVFCILFTAEVSLRIFAFGTQFFLGRNWAWNLFDCVVVGFQIIEQTIHLMAHAWSYNHTSIIRVLRILRFMRITRLVRIVRLVEELHTIMSSIIASFMALVWTLMLLVMIIYVASVFVTQITLEMNDTPHIAKVRYYFGRLPRSMLTMFEVIVGGVSWDDVAEPLMADLSPAMGVVFSIYIAFCVFAMMNMATGVFVDQAIRRAQEDRDTYTANHIGRLFFEDGDTHQEISYEVFVQKIDTPDMQEYFKAINVDPSEAKGLFQLLDADDSGTVDAEELVNGCLRLRGHAKALELSLIRHDFSRMFANIARSIDKLSKKVRLAPEFQVEKGVENDGSQSGEVLEYGSFFTDPSASMHIMTDTPGAVDDPLQTRTISVNTC